MALTPYESIMQEEEMGPAYGTAANPARGPRIEGGWGGILAAGASALAGIATDNPYLVAFGSGMGKSLGESYDRLGETLTKEQSAQRLRDSEYQRERNLKRFDRQLTQPDRDQAQENFEAEQALAGRQEDRLATQSQATVNLMEAQLAEAQKTPAQKAQDQLVVQEILAEAAEARTAGQQQKQIADLREMGVPETTIRMVELQHAGLDVSKLMGQKGAKMTGETFAKVASESSEYFRTTEQHALNKAELGEAKAEQLADQYGMETAQIVRQNFEGGSGGGLDLGALTGTGEEKKKVPPVATVIQWLQSGDETKESLLEKAETPEQKAVIEQAVKMVGEQPRPAPVAPAVIFSGGPPTPIDTRTSQEPMPSEAAGALQNLPSYSDPSQLDTSYRERRTSTLR